MSFSYLVLVELLLQDMSVGRHEQALGESSELLAEPAERPGAGLLELSAVTQRALDLRLAVVQLLLQRVVLAADGGQLGLDLRAGGWVGQDLAQLRACRLRVGQQRPLALQLPLQVLEKSKFK